MSTINMKWYSSTRSIRHKKLSQCQVDIIQILIIYRICFDVGTRFQIMRFMSHLLMCLSSAHVQKKVDKPQQVKRWLNRCRGWKSPSSLRLKNLASEIQHVLVDEEVQENHDSQKNPTRIGRQRSSSSIGRG